MSLLELKRFKLFQVPNGICDIFLKKQRTYSFLITLVVVRSQKKKKKKNCILVFRSHFMATLTVTLVHLQHVRTLCLNSLVYYEK